MKVADRIANLGFYAFAEVQSMVDKLNEQGVETIDFGVGDPIDPTPEIIRKACKEAIDNRKSSGYPSYIGDSKFRQSAVEWMQKRFGFSLDSNSEITSTIGSKEAVFHFPLAFVNPGDFVISPNPGYPPYERGTLFAGGKNYFLPLLPENDFLMDLDSVPEDIAKKTKILWINYPSNPCGVSTSVDFYKKAIAFCRKYDIILASDECYTEFYYGDEYRPTSVLQFAKKTDPVVAIFSLSKRSNMTCYRVGWVAGNKEIIDAFKKVKTNIDSGTPTFIQDAAVVALKDEKHVKEMLEKYSERREILMKTFQKIGWKKSASNSTFYIWQQIPDNFSNSVEFAKQLLSPEIGVIVTPGEWISHTIDGINPGEKFVRFALVPSKEKTLLAAKKIEKAFG